MNRIILAVYKRIKKFGRFLINLNLRYLLSKLRIYDNKYDSVGKLLSKHDYLKIKNKKRYEEGSITFKGIELHFADAHSLESMIRELFINGNYANVYDSDEPYVIDCGANIGVSVIYFKENNPNAEILAIEPDPNIFQLLKNNINIRKYENVCCKNAAVWINDNILNFQSEGSWGGYVGDQVIDQTNETYEIQALDLNNIIDRKVDLLKIDIEGAETEVLLNAKDSIFKYVENLFFEWHSITGKKQQLGKILTHFENNGFRYHIKEASEKKHPFIERRLHRRMDSQLDVFLYKV